jgi:hypothetical protein
MLPAGDAVVSSGTVVAAMQFLSGNATFWIFYFASW